MVNINGRLTSHSAPEGPPRPARTSCSQTSIENACDGAGVQAGGAHHILPLLKLSAEYGMTLRTQDGGLLLEGEVKSDQAFGKLASTPLLAEVMGGLSEEAMSGILVGREPLRSGW